MNYIHLVIHGIINHMIHLIPPELSKSFISSLIVDTCPCPPVAVVVAAHVEAFAPFQYYFIPTEYRFPAADYRIYLLYPEYFIKYIFN